MRDELLSSEARGETGNYSGSSMLATPEVPSEPVIATETVVAPEPVEPVIHTEARTPAKSGSSRLPVIGAAILALVVIAGALWWFLGRDKSPEVPPVEQAQQETPASASAAAPEPVAHSTCSAQGLNSQNELDFVQSCVQEKLDSDKLLTIIQAAKRLKNVVLHSVCMLTVPGVVIPKSRSCTQVNTTRNTTSQVNVSKHRIKILQHIGTKPFCKRSLTTKQPNSALRS